jgi:hypothetical protein
VRGLPANRAELAHLKNRAHDRAFWDAVAPDYEESRSVDPLDGSALLPLPPPGAPPPFELEQAASSGAMTAQRANANGFWFKTHLGGLGDGNVRISAAGTQGADFLGSSDHQG